MPLTLFDEQLAVLEAQGNQLLPRGKAILVAGRDANVRAKLKEKLDAGHVFRRIGAARAAALRDHWLVVFSFDAAPGSVGLQPPRFVAVANLLSGAVVDIVDPYIA